MLTFDATSGRGVTMRALAALALLQVEHMKRGGVVRILKDAHALRSELDASVDETPVDALADLLMRMHPPDRIDAGMLRTALDAAMRAFAACVRQGFGLVAHGDPLYPVMPDRMGDPPALLYFAGDPMCMHRPWRMAFIGTRHPTEYGVMIGGELAAHLVRRGVTIVGGLATGCDTIGHKAAADAGVPTVATLPSGLANIFPAENRGLAARILAAGGLLVSEYPPEVSPLRHRFIERDRLQASIGQAVLVVETEVNGGTMFTVDFARKYGRPLAVVAAHVRAGVVREPAAGNYRILSGGGSISVRECADLDPLIDALDGGRP